MLAVILVFTSAALTVTPHAPPAQGAGPYPKKIDVQRPPVRGVTTAGGETARMADGRYRTWVVVSGTTVEDDPGYLAEVDPFTGRMLARYVMATAGGAWGVSVSPDGNFVYATTYGSGHAYRLKYTSPRSFTDLGAPTAESSFLWEGDTDDQGNLWIGTYQGSAANKTAGLLASWRPGTGWTNHGGYGMPYEYVRTVEYARGQVYVGLGPRTGFYRHDPATGNDFQIPLPPGVPGDMYTYQLDDAGDYLFVYFSGGTSAPRGWLYNLVTQQWVREVEGYHGSTVSDIGADGLIYIVSSGEIVGYEPVTGAITHTGFTGGDGVQLGGAKGIQRGVDPATGHEMVVTGQSNGALARFDLVTRTGSYLTWDEVGLVPTLTPLRSMGVGPNGWVYVGGYFAGGLAGYDPDAEVWHEYPFPFQIEGMSAHGRKMYFGVYPSSSLWEYDPTQPFSTGTNPRKLFDLRQHGQERPWTVVSAGRYVAVGTSPKNSKADGAGAVTLYDPADGSVRVFNGIAGAGEIGALTYRNGILYGGSMNCCTAATPGDGSLFALDVATGAKLWQTVPLAGERGVNGLAFGNDPNVIIGVTAGKAFRYNVSTRQLLSSTTLFSYPWSSVRNFQPRSVNLAFDPADGFIYGTSVSRFLRLNPSTLANTAPSGWVGGWFAASATTGRKFALEPINGTTHLMMSQFSGRPSAPAMLYGSGASTTMFRWDSTEAAFTLGTGWQQSAGYDLANVGDRMVTGDLTCDGVDDIVAGYDTGSGLRFDVWDGKATTSGPQAWGTAAVAASMVGARMVSGDFDGNGCNDIAVVEALPGPGARIRRLLSNGSALAEPASGDWSTATDYDLSLVAGRVAAGDVDRDGRDDIIAAYDYGGFFRYHVWKGATAYSGANGWYRSGAFSLSNVGDRMVAGDFDGDGDDEPALFYHYGGSHARLFRWTSDGTQFTLASPDWEVESGYFLEMVGDRMAVGDVNDDGRDDVITAYDYGPDFRYHAWLSGWSYSGPAGWYDSGTFDLALVNGRLVTGVW